MKSFKSRRKAIRRITKLRGRDDHMTKESVTEQFVSHSNGRLINDWFIKNGWKDIGRACADSSGELSILTFEKDFHFAYVYSFVDIRLYGISYSLVDFATEVKRITADEAKDQAQLKQITAEPAQETREYMAYQEREAAIVAEQEELRIEETRQAQREQRYEFRPHWGSDFSEYMDQEEFWDGESYLAGDETENAIIDYIDQKYGATDPSVPPRNITDNISFIKEMAYNGDSEYQFMLGKCYETGKSVQQDYCAAVLWYDQSASNGYAKAMYNLGVMFKDGKGVPVDLTTGNNYILMSFLRVDDGDEPGCLTD